MPRMNGTGPLGQGVMTGRGMGPCGGGMKLGRCGQGRVFFRSAKNQTLTLEEEEKMLLNELEAIRAEKETLKGQK